MRLRLRILGVLAVLVGLNALFVLAVLWAYGVLVVGAVAGAIVFLQSGDVAYDFLRLPVSIPTYLALVAAFLAVQIYYGYRRVLDGTRGAVRDGESAVAATVRRLSMSVDVPAPSVRVVDSETPSCYTIGRVTDATIVVTTGLIELLDEDELAGVLAHELAHVKNRDVTLMTITTLFLEIANRAYNAAGLARRALTDRDALSDRARLALTWFAPLVVLTYVFVYPILTVFPAVADWATGTLSTTRELAADEAAAHVTGEPLALATALVTLSEHAPTPDSDLRTARTRALCVVPTDLVSGGEAETIPTPEAADSAFGRDREVQRWLDGETPSTATVSDTHPPVEQRVRRLQEIAAELEGGA